MTVNNSFPKWMKELSALFGGTACDCRHRKEMTTLRWGKLASWIKQGRIDITNGKIITMKELLDSGAVHGVKEGGVKLLGNVLGNLLYITLPR